MSRVERRGRIDAFALRRGIDNVLLTADGNLITDSVKTIKLHSGVRTIQTALELQDLPTRVTTFTPLPSSFLAHFFADGYDEQRIVYIRGSRLTKERIVEDIRQSIDNSKNRNRNRKILERSTRELLEDGTITAENVRNVNDTKKLMADLDREENLNDDLELDEVYEIAMRRGTYYKASREYRVQDAGREPYTISIESCKGLLECKLKHYWIYSHEPSYGKSYALHRFASKYNAHFVKDPNNWIGVPKAALFIILEECGPTNKLPLQFLKSLTAESADGMSGNCKSYGQYYEARDDVQIIVLSNHSPYEVYGPYNPKLARRVMDNNLMHQMEDRFFVHRVDGPLEVDRIRIMEPRNWTDEQLAVQLGKVFEPLQKCGGGNGIDGLTTRQAIPRVFGLIRQARHLLHARYQVSDCGQTTTDLFAVRLDALPIFLPSLKSSLGDIARALYNSQDQKKTGMPWAASLERLIEDENAMRYRSRSRCLEELIETEQHRLLTDAAYTHYVKAKLRYFYDGVFAATFVPGDVDAKDIYTPDVLREMLAELDSHFGPELFATRQIYKFVKVVHEEFLNADQSRVTEMEMHIQRISSAVHDRRVNGGRNNSDDEDMSPRKRQRSNDDEHHGPATQRQRLDSRLQALVDDMQQQPSLSRCKMCHRPSASHPPILKGVSCGHRFCCKEFLKKYAVKIVSVYGGSTQCFVCDKPGPAAYVK